MIAKNRAKGILAKINGTALGDFHLQIASANHNNSLHPIDKTHYPRDNACTKFCQNYLSIPCLYKMILQFGRFNNRNSMMTLEGEHAELHPDIIERMVNDAWVIISITEKSLKTSGFHRLCLFFYPLKLRPISHQFCKIQLFGKFRLQRRYILFYFRQQCFCLFFSKAEKLWTVCRRKKSRRGQE